MELGNPQSETHLMEMEKGSRNKIKINFTWDLGMIPTLKNPMFPLSILVQSTTVEAMFSGEGPSHRTASTWRAAVHTKFPSGTWEKRGQFLPLNSR